jgi:hypothetical protein
MNQAFEINNTTKDITHSGPVAQELALHKGAKVLVDMNVSSQNPFPISMMKQAALGTTVVVDILNPGGDALVDFIIGPIVPPPPGSVARALVKELNFKRVGDCALLHFFSCNFAKNMTGDTIRVFSQDLHISGGPILFFGGVANKRGGEAVLEIRVTSLTPGIETLELSGGDNAFV